MDASWIAVFFKCDTVGTEMCRFVQILQTAEGAGAGQLTTNCSCYNLISCCSIIVYTWIPLFTSTFDHNPFAANCPGHDPISSVFIGY